MAWRGKGLMIDIDEIYRQVRIEASAILAVVLVAGVLLTAGVVLGYVLGVCEMRGGW